MKFQKTLLASMISTVILTGCGGSDSDSPEIETPVNTAPVAQSDVASTENGVAITIDVLSNDTDADGDTLTITSVSDAQFGTAEITDGVITYTPNELAMGTDTLTYEISDGESTASGSVEIQQTQSVALSGIVTDSPITNADVTITVGDDTFTTTTDGAGRFEITVRASDPDALVSFVGQGVDSQSQVTLTSNGGTFLGLLSAAMTDGERDLNDTESDLTKVTHISTAQTLLYNDYLSEGGEKTFLDWVKTVFTDDVINLAGFIKLLVDNPDYAVPEGETTLSLFADTDMNSQQVIYAYLDDLGLVEENGTFSADYLDDRRAAIDETLDDPLLRTEFVLDDVSGKTWGEVVLLPRLTRDGSVYTFLEDGTGTFSGMLGFTMIPEKNDFLWSLNDGSVDIEFIKDDSRDDNELLYVFSCNEGGEEELGLYFEQADIDAFLKECTDSANSIDVLRENVGISYSLIQASGPSKLTVAADKYKWTSANHETTTIENSERSMYVINQEVSTDFSEDMLASGEWLLPVNTTAEFFQDGYTDPIATRKGYFSYEGLRFDNGVITGTITDEQGTYSIADGELSMTLEDTTVTAKHLFDTEHYSVAMYSTERNGQTYKWTGYLKNTNVESTQNLEMGQALPNLWTVYINDGLEGLFSDGLPTLNGAFGFNLNPDGTMRRIFSNIEGTEITDDAPLEWTWSQDGNTLTFNGSFPDVDDYSRQRIWELVNVDDEGYVTVLERFNITGRFSPILSESRVNVIKLLDWSEIFPEKWADAEFQTGNSASPLMEMKNGESKAMPH